MTANGNALIEMRGISVRRESTIILDGISLRIERGEHAAILGPNGAGKSSLLKLLTRDFYPSVSTDGHQGEIKILGESRWEVASLRRRMGIISPELDRHFHSGRTGRMTVQETVASGYTATRLKEFGPRLDDPMRNRIESVLAFVELSDLTHRRVETLSTGERRRTLIARALVHKPDVLVLDEPTSGLDIAARQIFLNVIDRVTKQHSTTVVLVTHHLSEIPPSVDRAILLKAGKLMVDGNKTETLTDHRLSDLFGVPLQVRTRSDGWMDAQLCDPQEGSIKRFDA